MDMPVYLFRDFVSALHDVLKTRQQNSGGKGKRK
nr:MAG TPA: hypothetical protein [Caudoviricetes sp.]